MLWNKDTGKLVFSQADMQLMQQCGMSFREVPVTANTVPPLWSILSYAMMCGGSTAGDIWASYRFLKQMSFNPDRFYYETQIPKAGGGMRTLNVPNVYIRCEQRRIMDEILSGLPVDEHACAYRRGISTETCATPHIGQGVLIHLDLKNFFGSIKENMVFSTLHRETGYNKSLCRFLARLCCYHKSLPQGAVTSPMLSNIVFRPCDEALATIAENHQLAYTRYSDDLFFSGSADTDVSAVLSAVSKTLKAHGFQLNHEKTKIRRPQHRQAVLGYTVNERLQVNRTYIRKLMQELYYLEKFERNCNGARQYGYPQYLRQLMGRVSYALHADPKNQALREADLKLRMRLYCYF